VTCYFCHNVEAVEGSHNNPLRLALDDTMRGGVTDPVANEAHPSAYSSLLDQATLQSSALCGSCHDIVTPNGVHLERTFKEWSDSFYAAAVPGTAQPDPSTSLRCGNCHMGPASPGPIADAPGVRGDRLFHPHAMAGIDVAVTDFPDDELGPQLRQEQLHEMELVRRTSVCASICLHEPPEGGTNLDVWLHNESAGHAWPSGAAQDRRAWVELMAFAGDRLAFQSGRIPAGTAVDGFDDPWLWVLRDRMFDSADEEVHMFWEAARVESELLPVAAEATPRGDFGTWQVSTYHSDSVDLDRVEVRLHIRPIALSTIDSLIESGDLDPAIRASIPTFSIDGAQVVWTPTEARAFPGFGLCVSSSNNCGAPLSAFNTGDAGKCSELPPGAAAHTFRCAGN
jgi:hypothetical protein